MDNSNDDRIAILTANGLRGSAAGQTQPPGGLMCVTLDTGRRLWVAPELLIPQADGGYLLPIAVSKEPDGSQAEAVETTILPVIEETASVRKREVQTGGVRISKVVHERTEQVAAETLRERLDVRREPVDEFVAEAEPARQEGDTTIVPIYEEVVVVEKRLRLKERWVITRQRETHTETQPVALRSEEAIIEQMGANEAHGQPGPRTAPEDSTGQ